jgi:hypothetical protein
MQVLAQRCSWMRANALILTPLAPVDRDSVWSFTLSFAGTTLNKSLSHSTHLYNG